MKLDLAGVAAMASHAAGVDAAEGLYTRLAREREREQFATASVPQASRPGTLICPRKS